MCSCHRDGKPHTDACRAAQRRYEERRLRDPTMRIQRVMYKTMYHCRKQVANARARAEGLYD